MTTQSSPQPLWQWLKKPVYLNELTAVIFFSFVFVIFENIAFWQKIISLMEWGHWKNYVLSLSFFIFIFCAITVLFSLLLWRPFFKYLLIALFLISAGVNYFCITYGVYIDREMIQNVMRTDSHETFALLTPQFITWLMLFGLIPALLVIKIRLQKPPSLIKHIFYRASIIVICIFAMLAAALPLYKEYASFFRNNREVSKLINPTNYIHAIYKYAQLHLEGTKPFIPIGLDAQLILPEQTQKPTLFIMVVGEASRAQNFSLLGYQKPTNPLLSQQTDALAFQNVTSCGTSTAVSVPCMFSNMPRTSYSASKASHQESVLDIIQRAGVNVVWRENNTGCQGLCTNIPFQSVRAEQPQGCKEDYCYDEQLLGNVDQYIAEHKGQNMLIVLHTIGSHGPSYYRRYSEDKITPFEPACNTNQIQNCSQEELVNTYDNTILNVDYTLNKTIEVLKNYESQYEVAMLYMSDHGQSLGEHGIYLHGTPYMIAPAEQTQIPMIFWASNEFITTRQINKGCMQQNAQKLEYSHDNLFHTLLGLMHVSTSEYQQDLDIFKPCQN